MKYNTNATQYQYASCPPENLEQGIMLHFVFLMTSNMIPKPKQIIKYILIQLIY